jgi:gliding motility-associated-like protein
MSQTHFTNLRRIGGLYPFFLTLLLLVGVGSAYGQPTIAYTATSACASPISTLEIQVTGAVGTPLYSLDGSPSQANRFFYNVGGGVHTFTVQDNTGTYPVTFTIDCMQNIVVGQAGAVCNNPNGTLTVTSFDLTIPPGSTTSIDASTASGYLYSIDLGATWQSSPVFSNIPGKMYTVMVKDPNNTTGSTSLILGGVGGATPMPTVTQNAGCANNDGSINVVAGGGLAPFSFKIDDKSYVAEPLGTTSDDFPALTSGDHTVWIKDNNGCETSATITVPLINTLQLSMGADQTICEGKTVVLGATSPNGVSFSWTPTESLANSKTLRPIAKPTTTTTYTLTATWGPCTQTGSETVVVNPAPTADAGTADATCYMRSEVLHGSGAGTGALTYSWRPATFLDDPTIATPTMVQPTATTTYHLAVTDGNNCTSLNNAQVTVAVTPPPQVFAGNDTNVVAGQAVLLQAVDVEGIGFIKYEWSPAFGLSNTVGPDVAVVSATTTQTYTVLATTAAGCIGLDSITVKVFTKSDIFVPNAFSPNHDGHNDVLRVVASSIQQLHEFAVFDRGGAKVFTTSNAAVGWDGTRNGRELPPGVYVWMAVGWDWQGHLLERKGTVVLVR